MKRALILFLIMVPAILMAQNDSSKKEQKLLLRVPLFNGGLSLPMQSQSQLPKDRGISIHSLGTGIWYFNRTRFSYQLDLTADFNFGRYIAYDQMEENGPVVFSADPKNYTFATPAIGGAVNYELLDLDATKFYIYLRYTSHLFSWTSRETTAAGDAEMIDNIVYSGFHYNEVYRNTLRSKRPLQQIHLGFTISDYRNRIEVRFFSIINPPQDYVYKAESALSDPSPTIEWTERTNMIMDVGISLNFNILVHSARTSVHD